MDVAEEDNYYDAVDTDNSEDIDYVLRKDEESSDNQGNNRRNNSHKEDIDEHANNDAENAEISNLNIRKRKRMKKPKTWKKYSEMQKRRVEFFQKESTTPEKDTKNSEGHFEKQIVFPLAASKYEYQVSISDD
ncbi:hypothetical protein ILUMI_23233 [Ignelater luminosus]|uniref:Uncharacterized protein n=1 Tax=Ignelater luminosus TaxID=2038154 RepID=A0A8K0G233_IGNLU|nr:hypothetical protein ILUMI_23233 [Ignelater luminosus]